MRISFINETKKEMEVLVSEDILAREEENCLLIQSCKDNNVMKGVEIDLSYTLSFNGNLGVSGMDIIKGISEALLQYDDISITVDDKKKIVNIKSTW